MCVDLSTKVIPTQTNTHQSNSCCGPPGLGVGDTGGCSGNMMIKEDDKVINR